ncbi:type II toxin-antitoxin system VapC family toxin [Caenimonas koreensis]|uniref:type II toxin-antitoxin system VapC family toxin n=1 Tax=Caenimonas koreensis TaxID=367474 RepID=UPI003784AF2D
MIVLDTNVVSEALKVRPDDAVSTWLNEQAIETLFLPSVTVAELLLGIAALPAGKKRTALTAAVDGLLALFQGRVLPFDADAARRYAELAMLARKRGRGFPTPDGYIASIAASRRFIVASRDTGPYEAAGVKVINPWLSAHSGRA